MQFSELETGIKKFMLLEDTGLIKLVTAIIVANQLPIIPPWIMIVGASSGGKSMILNAIKDVKGLVKIDDLTSNTFLSGMKGQGQQTSLLHNLPTNPIMCFSDFTTIISKNKETRAEIFGQLRRIWDGDMHKKTGNGENKVWEGKAGLIGGVTTTIYAVLPEMGDMGERLVLYHYKMPDRKIVTKFALRALNDRGNEKIMRELFKRFMEELPIPAELPQFSEEFEDEVVDLADLATRARSSVQRDQYDRQKSVLMVHDLEMPARLAKTIISVAMGMAVVNGGNELETIDRQTLYRLALDSIPLNRKLVLNSLTEYDMQKSDDIQVRLNMDKNLVERTLQDLNSLGVVTKGRGIGGSGWVWQLKEGYRALLSRFEGIVMQATNVPIADTVVESEPELWDNIIKQGETL